MGSTFAAPGPVGGAGPGCNSLRPVHRTESADAGGGRNVRSSRRQPARHGDIRAISPTAHLRAPRIARPSSSGCETRPGSRTPRDVEFVQNLADLLALAREDLVEAIPQSCIPLAHSH